MLNHFNKILLASIIISAQQGLGVELMGMRSLQQGPLGDGLSFASVGPSEAEGSLSLSNATGTAKTDDDKLTGSTFKSKSSAAFGMNLSESARFAGFGTVNSFEYSATTQKLPKSKYENQYKTYEIGAGPALEVAPFVIGGSVSILTIGDEERKVEVRGDVSKHEISKATMPLMRGFFGLASNNLKVVLGAKLFNAAVANSKSTDGAGKAYEFEVLRRSPAELRFDSKISIPDTVDFGFGLTYLTTGQASEEINEYSLSTTRNVNGVETRDKGGLLRNANHLRLEVGGSYHATDVMSLLAAIHLVDKSYSRLEFASLEHENLGGTRIDVGTFFKGQGFSASGGLGYIIPSAREFTKETLTSADWADMGNKIKIEQALWEVTLSGSLIF